jgi:hypothetical protein
MQHVLNPKKKRKTASLKQLQAMGAKTEGCSRPMETEEIENSKRQINC